MKFDFKFVEIYVIYFAVISILKLLLVRTESTKPQYTANVNVIYHPPIKCLKGYFEYGTECFKFLPMTLSKPEILHECRKNNGFLAHPENPRMLVRHMFARRMLKHNTYLTHISAYNEKEETIFKRRSNPIGQKPGKIFPGRSAIESRGKCTILRVRRGNGVTLNNINCGFEGTGLCESHPINL